MNGESKTSTFLIAPPNFFQSAVNQRGTLIRYSRVDVAHWAVQRAANLLGLPLGRVGKIMGNEYYSHAYRWVHGKTRMAPKYYDKLICLLDMKFRGLDTSQIKTI